ncbi:MAG: hypothetical protein K8U03_08050 [Planctomycetia bacterium]|nr:hypothetical protein [Planctomycetia bacterium]
MLRYVKDLWTDESGFVLSTEMMLYGTVGVVGATTGLSAFRDAVNTELGDLAKAIGSLDQSYCISPVTGHHAYTAGSAFYDRADLPDVPQLQYVPQACVAPVGRPLVCADVFGPQAIPTNGPGPVPAPRALPQGALVPGSVQGVAVQQAGSKGVNVAPVPDANFSGGHHHHHVHHPRVAGQPYTAAQALNEPYLVDVPEGYFNVPPSGYVGPVSQFPAYLNRGLGNAPCNGCSPNVGYGHGVGVSLPADAVIVPAPVPVYYAPAIVTAEPAWNTIELGFAKVGDAELEYVEKFRTAKCLHVIGSNVTDKGLVYVGQMQQLESVHLVGTQITDAGLKELGKLKNLRFLHLVGTNITDAGLKNLSSLKQLQELDVRGTPVTDAGLAELSKSLPTLKVVR